MKKFLNFYRNTAERSRGQALVVIAVSFVALLLFVGLAIDGGMILVNYGNLRRSVDAASLAAASQVRDSTSFTDIELVAQSTMQLNGVDAGTVTVKTCEDTTGTPASFQDACASTVPRKLVYVNGSINSPLAFMRLLGFSTIPLSAWSVGEAAAVDVVLVIDVSDSMAGITAGTSTVYTSETGDWSENPQECNLYNGDEPEAPVGSGTPGDRPCVPFHFVKAAAKEFAQNVLDKDYNGQPGEEDRISIATFSVGYDSGSTKAHDIGGDVWSSDYSDVEAALDALTVYETNGICDENSSVISQHIGKCRKEDAFPDFQYRCGPTISMVHEYGQNESPTKEEDFSTCGTTSIGSGLLVAAALISDSATDRPNAIRVVILLTDGANNATGPKFNDCSNYQACDLETDIHPILLDTPFEDHYFGYCPDDTNSHFCRDGDVLTRHIPDLGTWEFCPMLLHTEPADLAAMSAPECPTNYDADDFALDIAEFVGCPGILPSDSNCRSGGAGAVIFTIGMGSQVSGSSLDDSGRPYGAYLLRYIAAIGEDGNPIDTTTANCTGDCVIDFGGDSDTCKAYAVVPDDLEENCGNYYHAADATKLGPVFEAIAARIFTRIAQ